MLLYFLLLHSCYFVIWVTKMHDWTIPYHGARPCIFRQGITFHPNNLAHPHLCQHSQGVQVGSICRMQLKPGDMGVRWISSTWGTGGFFQHFSRGGQKLWNLFFPARNYENNLSSEIFTIQRGALVPLPPLPTPMPSDMSVSPSILRLF